MFRNIEGHFVMQKKDLLKIYFTLFEIIRKANIVCVLREKLEGSVIKRWLFISIPIFFYAVNIYIIISQDAFWNKCIKLSFVKDMSNSLVLTVLFFISYFLSYYFPSLFSRWKENGISKEYLNSLEIHPKRWMVMLVGLILLGIGILSGWSFSNTAMKNGLKIWTNHLDTFGVVMYSIFLGITWYNSLLVLGMALIGGFAIFWTIRKEKLVYNLLEFDKNLSIINALNMLLCTFSYGLFYIGGSILFIFNDKVAAKEEVYNTFSDDVAALCLVVSVLLIVVIAYIPLQEVISFMRRKKKELILHYERQIDDTIFENEKESLIKKRNAIIDKPLISTTVSNKLMIIASIIVPLIGVIFQGIELFRN